MQNARGLQVRESDNSIAAKWKGTMQTASAVKHHQNKEHSIVCNCHQLHQPSTASVCSTLKYVPWQSANIQFWIRNKDLLQMEMIHMLLFVVDPNCHAFFMSLRNSRVLR